MKNGANDVKQHRWFKDINWNDVFYQKLKVTFTPSPVNYPTSIP